MTRALGDHLMKKTTKGLTSTPFVQDIVTVDDSVQSTIVMASDGVCHPLPHLYLISLQSLYPQLIEEEKKNKKKKKKKRRGKGI